MTSGTRGSIFLEQARVISQLAYDAEQFVLRVSAPKCAAHAQPGAFVHLACDATIPMRRPLSIMRADRQAGWIELLYKVVGPGLHALAARKAGDELSVLGPIGR
ncbi:MAG: FAD-binding oxidoreductase, partial [Steroidobacteraceae bacterium]